MIYISQKFCSKLNGSYDAVCCEPDVQHTESFMYNIHVNMLLAYLMTCPTTYGTSCIATRKDFTLLSIHAR